MSRLDKLIMKTSKKSVQILLDVKSSFIWTPADGAVDLSSSLLKGPAGRQPTAITLRF